ncbi:pseudaminic acid cytidylyltransferase [Rhizobium leguminosarum]|uniref:pseudaminic acid cytidylyltransferase n=1 Tax=Rhizobium leguminosarum TaxID=384 RepID=UPI001AEB418D|nr:pseudaminic acid cytidylyltransferase [Rhizobium leguminosarum]MBP2447318.1 N-acylneuraminate cytidylyltransferase [Rhizobium leguminosarum]
MNEGSNAVCIIPARGGSKRIPRKNIRPFRGRPMLLWSVEAALMSGAFDSVLVSTDDDEIAEVARAAGAEVPFLRSARTSNDYASTADVLEEVLGQLGKIGHNYTLGCCLYPTAPFVQGEDLANGRARLEDSDFDVVMPIAAFSYPIWRSLARDAAGRVLLNFPENLNVRSQDLPTAYHDVGQWYWFRTAAFLRTHVLMGSNTGSIVVPAERMQDIDTEEDWAIAEYKHERLFG